MNLTKRQNEIIDAALELTAGGGIQNLTIKNVATKLGITEPAIYRHFGSKAEIVTAMIRRFDLAVVIDDGKSRGFEAVAAFIRARLAQAAAKPALARVMFAEELFMDDPKFTELVFAMMHRHKNALQRHFDEAREAGELRAGIAPDTLFRLVFGPVRLLVKQWGMTDGAFDLQLKGEELIDTLKLILK